MKIYSHILQIEKPKAWTSFYDAKEMLMNSLSTDSHGPQLLYIMDHTHLSSNH